MRIACLVLASLAVMAAVPTRARACDCPDKTPQILLPRNGATGVPTNARVLVSADVIGEGKWAAADATTPMPGLAVAPIAAPAKGSKPARPGSPVPVAVSAMMSEAWGTVYVVTPKQPLKAKTAYAVVKPGEKKGSLEIVGTFTTGAAADTQAPVFAGIDSFTAVIAYQRKLSDCDGDPPSEQLTWQIGAVSDDTTAPGDLIRILYVQKKGEQRTVRLIEPWDRAPVTAVTDRTCDPFHPVMKVGDEMCAVIEAVDLAGNASGAAVEKCMIAQGH